MGSASNSYVNCFQCEAPYNALIANWCSCIVAERTLVCPSCLKCFCRAPSFFKEDFWDIAPLGLVARRREEHSRPFPTSAGLPDSSLRRPLVLVVDDEAGIVRLAIRAIKGIGFGVVWCEDGS